MEPTSLRDQQKRRAWLRGVIAALVLVVLLVCVASMLWIIPVSDDGDDPGVRPDVATPVPIDQPTPTL